jgi:hypothetical protein
MEKFGARKVLLGLPPGQAPLPYRVFITKLSTLGSAILDHRLKMLGKADSEK